MKPTFRHKIIAIIIGLLVCGAMTAQTNYGIWIAGTRLTSANAGAITNANFPNLGLTSGTITYDHSTNTITLNGVNANVSSSHFISITSDAAAVTHKINLVGSNIASVATTTGNLCTEKDLVIEGSGSLKVTSNNNIGIYVSGATLTVRNTNVEAIGGYGGIMGNTSGQNEYLVIENSTVKATGGIKVFQNITLVGCAITQPSGAVVADMANGKAVMQGSSVVVSQVVISPAVTPHGIRIAGTELTTANADAINNTNFPGLGLTSGSITYDYPTNTITLNNVNANVVAGGFLEILSGGSNAVSFKINPIGNNVITTHMNSISIYKTCVIEGSGSLKLTSYSCGIYVGGPAMLVIKNTTLDVIGTWGIVGVDGTSGEKLVISRSTVKATGSSGSICDFQVLNVMGSCRILQPEGAAVAVNGSNGKAVMLNGSVVTSQVLIETVYTLPYSMGFEDYENYDLWTIVDANADGRTFVRETSGGNTEPGCMKYSYSSSNAANDWLISPNIVLPANTQIIVKLHAKRRSSSYPESFKIMLGQGKTPADFTQELLLVNNMSTSYDEYTAVFTTPATTGSYNIAIHAISNADMYNFYIDDISVRAATPYGIRIAGTELTNANIGAITNANFPNLGLTSGTITYDHSTKTFTLNSVNANVSSGEFIDITSGAEYANYKINLTGTNVITVATENGINVWNNLTIEGNGSLKVTSSDDIGVFVGDNATLTIINTTVEAIGFYGIVGNDGRSGEKLVIENSTVKATGNSGAIFDFQDITLTDCAITQPAGASVSSSSAIKAIVHGNSGVCSQVVISPAIRYGIEIADTEITSANVGAINNTNFPDLGLTSGTITYDHSTKTFTLNSVNANADVDAFIYIPTTAETAEYKINLIGNSVVNSRVDAISTDKNLTIEGSGSLKLTLNTDNGIYLGDNTTVTIRNTTVEVAAGYGVGIVGIDGTRGEKLVVENSTVKVAGSNGSIFDLQDITLTGCVITQPAGAAIATNGSRGKAVMLSGSVVTSQVLIVPEITSCPPVTNLTATVNPDKKVTLTWTNPPQSTWPTACDGDTYFEFYNGTSWIGSDDTDNLTSWTTGTALPADTHSLGVLISYWRNSNDNVCYSDTVWVSATIVSVPATVITNDATNITQSTATLNGTVNPGTDVIAERGFEWKLTTGGTYTELVSASTGNTFNANLSGIAAGTSYTFRAYVKVGENKIYGEAKSFTTISTGIENITQVVAIYPNPARDEATISVDDLNSDAIATIYDMQGKAVGSYTISAATGRVVVDVSAFADGTYLVRIVSKDINRVERLIIKR